MLIATHTKEIRNKKYQNLVAIVTLRFINPRKLLRFHLRTVQSISFICCFLTSVCVSQTVKSSKIYGYVVGGGEFVITARNISSGTSYIAKTTREFGKYEIVIPPGRYRVILSPKLGYPFEYQHSPFSVASGENLEIDFWPYQVGVLSRAVNGFYVSGYEQSVIREVTHFIAFNDSAQASELRILHYQEKSGEESVKYVTKSFSFEQFTGYPSSVFYDSEKMQIIAEGRDGEDFLIEDGHRKYSTAKAIIDIQARKLVLLESFSQTKSNTKIIGKADINSAQGIAGFDLMIAGNESDYIEFKTVSEGLIFRSEHIDSINYSNADSQTIDIRGDGSFNGKGKAAFVLKIDIADVKKMTAKSIGINFHFSGTRWAGAILHSNIKITKN
jgi:hypothetical protein